MDRDPHEKQPVLILGAGINGAAVARELVLNNVPVWIVDRNDIAFGATSKSSRLIHGGLRYLEYGEFRLVSESLRERNRMCRLAPQFVKPLRLHIPVERRTGGLIRSALRFLGPSRRRLYRRLRDFLSGNEPRGLWVVRIGLRFYDLLAGDFPRSRVRRAGAPTVPKVDAEKYRWLCAYTDAQILFPERFVLAQLEDARQAAAEKGIEFRLLTHHRALLTGRVAEIRRDGDGAVSHRLEPAAVVNATGAWGDFTLEELNTPSRKLFGGTKGSHVMTHRAELRQAIGDDGIYAEAADGRLVFVLPFGAGVLVGTTDEDFDDRPDKAVADEHEVAYLIEMVRELFPQIDLTHSDVDLHYSGVRPLPASNAGPNAAVSRDHWIEEHPYAELPMVTLVGGKLTTCRAFGEQVADQILPRLGIPRTADTRDRPYPGAEDYPTDDDALRHRWSQIAERTGFQVEQVQSVWSLCGTRATDILENLASEGKENLSGTNLPRAYVRWVIEHEWSPTLSDLVERRLMLLYSPDLSEKCLHDLADCLAEAGALHSSEKHAAVREAAARLERFYGRTPAAMGSKQAVSG